MTDAAKNSSFVYVTYIRTTPEKLWSALTDDVKFMNRPELKAEGDSQCTMELEPSGTAVKLSITHTIECEPSKFIAAVSGGWPKIISNLKSLLETGSIALQNAYPAGDQR